MTHQPDYTRILDAALNRSVDTFPLYDHNFDNGLIGEILNIDIKSLGASDNLADKREFFMNYAKFHKDMGYDVVIFEMCAGGAMPGSGSLGNHVPGVIKNYEDFEKYPWDEIPDRYFNMYDNNFKILAETMPDGMKAVGGVGNGIFECVQDVTGYMDLCYMKIDDPELYEAMFHKVGDMLYKIWSRFLEKYGDAFCICRFGDDLGFKSETLISHDDIKQLVLPQYKRIVDLVHSYNKPFLLHSCGQLFGVMDEIIDFTGIDAKHSNEDAIAPFSKWVQEYGDRIGNFGGIDTDVICSDDEKYVRDYTIDVLNSVNGKKGIAIGTGNSVPDYVSVTGYLTMNKTIREYRNKCKM
ncbi:MAG: uroporphyrinogen decarboxylase family protein [Eubacteriales bacterium]|nr:uroporphyrinogen decarboxylase family protein [Eubacteriales bacterium]